MMTTESLALNCYILAIQAKYYELNCFVYIQNAIKSNSVCIWSTVVATLY